MNSKAYKIIKICFLLVVGLYFMFLGLFEAKAFLIPLSLAIFLSLVMLPIAGWFEKKGLSRGMAVLLADLIILFFCTIIMFIVSLQIYQVVNDWPEYQKKLEPKYEQAMQYFSENYGISENEIQDKIKSSVEDASQGNPSKPGFVSRIFSFVGNFLLVFVYLFFLMYYRRKLKNSILEFVPEQNREKANDIIDKSSKVSQQYLFGRFLLILILAILYSIGLLILGVKQAILISLLAALLSLIPYVGNILGYGIALLMGILSGNGAGIIIGISAVFAIAQFVESYILEPFVVGEKVDLNPVLTIIGVVMFGMVWGVAGMFLAIPVLGVIKVISDNVKVLNPLGYTLGTEDVSTESGWVRKLKTWVTEKKNKIKS